MAATSEEKRAALKKSLSETRERRKTQVCKVFALKVDLSRCSKQTRESLCRLFVEAKWLRNAVVASENIYDFDTRIKEVQVKIGEDFETRPFVVLGSQIKQSIHEQIKSEILGLSTKKKRGEKVGRLKFKSHVGSVNLKQHGTTYTLSPTGRLRIQNIKQRLRTRGIDQIPRGADFANARLLHRHGDFFLHVTCYVTSEELAEHKAKKKPKPVVEKMEGLGLDFGIANQVTTSNGIAIQYRVPISPQIKKQHKKVSKTKKGSKNRRKARQRLQKAYAKTTKLKENIKNQLVGLFCLVSKWVCVQDDYVKGWQKIWGKRVFETSIGGILGKLKQLPSTRVVERWRATSQECRMCHVKTKHRLAERVFDCKHCGHREERDLHSARLIRAIGFAQTIGTESPESRESQQVSLWTPADIHTSAFMLQCLKNIPHVQACWVTDAGSPSL